MGHTHTKRLFVVYLKFQFNCCPVFYLAILELSKGKIDLCMCVFYESHFIGKQRNELYFNFGIWEI